MSGPALLLFDIDGTLVHTRGAGLRALERAFGQLYGVLQPLNGSSTAGRTDVRIVEEIAERAGLTAADTAALLTAYLEALAVELARDPGVVLPGVHDLLAALQGAPEWRLALGTGNLEAGARLKLEALGIWHYFPVGGFASDAPERDDLIRRGVQKARQLYGCDFGRCIVVGDTPLDVACGRANGAATLAVATGRFGPAELVAAGADLVLPDLADTATALAALRQLKAGQGCR